MGPHPSRMHRRRWAIAVSITGALVMATLAAGETAGLRINATASMPRGLWRVQAHESIARGAIRQISARRRTVGTLAVAPADMSLW
jgi:type IV secretory pathway protease TraF